MSTTIGSAREAPRNESTQCNDNESLSARSNKSIQSSRSINSGRSNPATTIKSARSVNSARSNLATDRTSGEETFRTYMSTGRVHTALAALSAEKQALIAKLNVIDAALETGSRNNALKSRGRK